VFRFGRFELDPRAFELRRDGARVHVERQVFEVLRHLVEHRDRVVPKTELLDVVWHSRFVSEATLASRLKEARRAVDDDGHRQDVIATVHGVGYRFVAPVDHLTATDAAGAADATGATPPAADGTRWPQQIRFCATAEGVRIAYARSGSGPTLVKAANWLTHLDYEWESAIWSHWIDQLSARHTLVRYDERGCGLSDWEVEDFSVDAWVDDLAAVVDDAGLEDFDLIGVSQGGAVAIAYAVRNPERVRRLVLVGAYCRGRLARAEDDDQREEAAFDLAMARLAWARDDSTYRQVFASQFLPEAPPSRWEAFNTLQRATTSTENVVRFLEAFANIDVSAEAGQVRCPTLVVHCRRDVRVPLSQARELCRLIPASRLCLLDSGNHILTADEPAWPVLCRELDDFLDG
jgi:pimeloyl-ACP methyl ester carboxylesterase/DNA-binding winged helix-turn-helix (wHTH) protein